MRDYVLFTCALAMFLTISGCDNVDVIDTIPENIDHDIVETGIEEKIDLPILKSSRDLKQDIVKGLASLSAKGRDIKWINLPAIRADHVLAMFRGLFDGFKPAVAAMSLMLGLFLTVVLKESPLSPLPVPPLPNSPVGPYPPTNIYPFGVPPLKQRHPNYNAYNINYGHTNRRGRLLLEDLRSSRSLQAFRTILGRIAEEIYDKYIEPSLEKRASKPQPEEKLARKEQVSSK